LVDSEPGMTIPVNLVNEPVCNVAHSYWRALGVLLYEEGPSQALNSGVGR
jgi:hypothetical protein